MMANQNAASTSLTGESSALGPNSSEMPVQPTSDYEYYLQAVSPELVEQMDIEAQSLDSWLQFKTKTYLIREIFAHRDENPRVDPIDAFLSKDFSISLPEIRDEVILPELEQQEVDYIENSSYIKGRQIPEMTKKLTRATEEYQSVQQDLIMLSNSNGSRSVKSSPEDVQKWFRKKQNDIDVLSHDLDGQRLRARLQDSMVAYVNRLLNDSSEDGLLMETVDKAAHNAKLDVYREIIGMLKSQMALTNEGSHEYHELMRKIVTLEAEGESLIIVKNMTDDTQVTSEIESETSFDQQTTPEIHLAPRQPLTLLRAIGSFGLSGSGFAMKLFSK